MKTRELIKILSNRNWLFNIALIAMLFMQFGMTRSNGSYNVWTGEISCNSRETCLHEVAHKYDHTQGWITKTKEYQHSIDVYRMLLLVYPQNRTDRWLDVVEYPGLGSIKWLNTNPFTMSFWTGGWGGYTELYASIVQWSDGDPNKCPQELRDWYDWNFINSEMEKLEVENGRLPDFNKSMD